MTIETRSGHVGSVRATESGTYIFPLSSETPYRRYDGLEILDHSDGSIDLSFLNSGNAPLLNAHGRWELRDQIGVVKRAWVESKRLYVEVKFSNRASAQEIKQDVDDGIIRNVSVGYDIDRSSIQRTDDSAEYRVMKWTPKEASFVPIPADETVGMGRSRKPQEAKMADKDEVKVLPGMESEAQTEEQRAEAMQEASAEIVALAQSHNRADLANDYIKGVLRAGGEPSVAVFKGLMRAELPEDVPLVNRDIGLTEDERKSFSVRALLATFGDNGDRARKDAEFELEAVEAASEHSRHGGVVLPEEVMRNWGDFQIDGVHSSQLQARAAMATSGNANVQDTAHLANRFIDNLRNRMVLGRLGLTMLTGLDGNLEIPGGDTNISAAWLGSEDDDAAESNPSFRKISMAIHDIAVYTDMTRRMLIQTTIDIEQYVRNQILEAMAQGIDLAGFYGSGAAGQPTGIINTTGIGSDTFAAATPTRDELIDMRALITATNQPTPATFVYNTNMEAALMKVNIDTGSGIFLADAKTGTLDIGNRYETTNQFTDGDVLAGVFSDAIMGMWGSLELDRSTEAKFLSGGLRLRAIQSVDFGVRRVGSFAFGNDTP